MGREGEEIKGDPFFYLRSTPLISSHSRLSLLSGGALAQEKKAVQETHDMIG